MAGKEKPTGVKVISIFYYVLGALSVIGGLMFLLGGSFFGSLMPGLGTLIGGIAAVIGIFAIILGVLEIFVGNGLWKLKSWAKITAIVLSVLGVLSGLTSLAGNVIMGLIYIAVDGLIIYYLGFHKETKGLFK